MLKRLGMKCLSGRCWHCKLGRVVWALPLPRVVDRWLMGEPEFDSSERLDIPEDVSLFISEAFLGREKGLYLSVTMVCRSAVQLALRHKGVEDGPLSRMIKVAADRGLMDEGLVMECSAAKLIGDIAAHPELGTDFSFWEIDADCSIQAMLNVMEVLFERERV